MKRNFYLTFSFILFFILLAGCSNVSESEFELEKRIHIDTDELTFSASATQKYDVKVVSSVKNWDVVSDDEWCKIEKGETSFMITALPNEVVNERKSKISVLIQGVVKQTIDVTQTTAASGEINPQTSYWDDTHWRWYELKGRVKTYRIETILNTYYYKEFNQDGKVSIFSSGQILSSPNRPADSYRRFEYDTQGRTTKEYIVSEGIEWLSREYVLGNNEKYIPLPSTHYYKTGMGDVALRKGVTGVRFYDNDGTLTQSIDYVISQDKITYKASSYSVEYKYTGSNLPTSETVVGESLHKYYTFEYSTNGRFAEIVLFNQAHNVYSVDASFFDTADGPYLKLIKQYTLEEGNDPSTVNRPTYIEPDTSGWKFDEHGNWTERPSIVYPQQMEKCVITYYE